ncbi:hypothetical protein QZH41_004085 [Actinostola sp. cb2023]|nr:hypothetical protein QZH41_004085 [Actinostola sp. cb2023]
MNASVQYRSPSERQGVLRKKVRFADTSPKCGVQFTSIKIITPNNSSDNLFGIASPTGKLKPWVYNCTRCQFILAKNTLESRVMQKNVCLENVLCSQFAVLGLIRVKNIDFVKDITVRYTMNDWKTYRDIWADYVSSSPDKTTDKFTFRIAIYSWLFEDHCNVDFAVCYKVAGAEHWDNNDGKNYRVSCCKAFRF